MAMKRSTRLRRVALGLVAVVILVVLAAAYGERRRTASARAQMDSFEIIDDNSRPETADFWYMVLIEPGTSPEQIEALGRGIIKGAMDERPLHKIRLWFYDYPELADDAGPPLGEMTFGPLTMGPANPVEPGEYDRMSLLVDLPEKDWAVRPSQSDVDVWVYRHDLPWNGQLPGKGMTRLDWGRLTAKEFHLTVSEVRASLKAVNEWVPYLQGGRSTF
jgi:hypothetical protein